MLYIILKLLMSKIYIFKIWEAISFPIATNVSLKYSYSFEVVYNYSLASVDYVYNYSLYGKAGLTVGGFLVTCIRATRLQPSQMMQPLL